MTLVTFRGGRNHGKPRIDSIVRLTWSKFELRHFAHDDGVMREFEEGRMLLDAARHYASA